MNLECDECGQPVWFSGPGRTYEHTHPTTCTGIDGIVLGVAAKDRLTAVIDLASRGRARPE